MKLSKPDLMAMRSSILAVCAAALFGVAILYGSDQYAEHVQQNRNSAQRLMNEAQSRLAAARLDQKNMSAYSSEYGALEDGRIIGDEQRLDWMEGLENLRRQNLVMDFRYRIAPQKTYPQTRMDSGNFDIHYSEMKLQFDLLHEAQLPDFFAALRSQVKGWYQLEGCALQRNTAMQGDESSLPQIKAECSGGWITLKNRNAAK